MKSTVILIVGFMLVSTSLVVAIPINPMKSPSEKLFTHSVLGEYGTATWCGYCKYAHGALKEIFIEDNYPFYYVSYVGDKNTVGYNHMNSYYNLYGYPTLWFDGGYKVNVGAGSQSQAKATYEASITSSSNRAVYDVDILLNVVWGGGTQMTIYVTINNNEPTTYNGDIRVYITELMSSMGWYDTAGYLYTFPFLDFAFNQPISIAAGGSWSNSISWNGTTHGYSSITEDNLMIIAAVFNDDWHQGYSYPPSSNPFDAYYVDDTVGFLVSGNLPPAMPNTPSPTNNAINVSLDELLSWDSEDPQWFDTVYYDVYFEANDPTPDVLVSNGQTSTQYDPGPLALSTTYYWKIVAEDNHGASIEGPIWQFTTRGNTPPYIPNTPDPYDGEIGVYINKILEWIGGDPENDPVTYDVYFGTTTSPPLVAANVTTSEYDPGILSFNTNYYWKIISWDSFGETTSGPEWTFTTEVNQPPYMPSDPNPEDGAIEVNIETDLFWTGGDPNPGDAITYDVFFGTTNPPPLVKQNQTFTQYNPGTMDLETTYYWKIISWDSEEENSVGNIWSFTTASAPNVAPTEPEISGKTNIKVNTEYDYTFTTTDDNEDEIYLYVTWGDGATTDWIGPYASGEVVTLSHSWENKGDFTIQAKAKDPFDLESGWSSLEISVPVIHTVQPSVFCFGLFPQMQENTLRFWRGSWQEISTDNFQGYCGKIIMIGKVC
jgi:hypothetical protein